MHINVLCARSSDEMPMSHQVLTGHRTLAMLVRVKWHYDVTQLRVQTGSSCVFRLDGEKQVMGELAYLSIRWCPDELVKSVFHLLHECHLHTTCYSEANSAGWLRNARRGADLSDKLLLPQVLCNACLSS